MTRDLSLELTEKGLTTENLKTMVHSRNQTKIPSQGHAYVLPLIITREWIEKGTDRRLLGSEGQKEGWPQFEAYMDRA